MKKSKNISVIKILVPALILVAIGGMFIVKTNKEKPADTTVEIEYEGSIFPEEVPSTPVAAPQLQETEQTPEVVPEQEASSEAITEATVTEEPEPTKKPEPKPTKEPEPEPEPENDLDGADFSLHATEKIDYAGLAEYGIPIIVDYGSDSCIPCKAMAPALENLNREFEGKAFVKFVDVWKYSKAVGNVPISVIPSQVFFDANGDPFRPSDSLSASINFASIDGYTIHMGGLTEEELRAILQEMGA